MNGSVSGYVSRSMSRSVSRSQRESMGGWCHNHFVMIFHSFYISEV